MPRPMRLADQPRNLTVSEAAAWVGGYPDTPQGHENFRRVYLRLLKTRQIRPVYWGRQLRIPSTDLANLLFPTPVQRAERRFV